MKNYILLGCCIAIFIACGGNDQTTSSSATAMEVTPHLSRIVEGNILASDTLPNIKIKVADDFQYIGKFDFEIIANSDEYAADVRGKAVATGDRFVFAVADEQKVIEKLFIVQLEGFLPEFGFTYNYNFSQAETIGANKYRHNTWFYDSKAAAQRNPQNEGALTRAFLKGKGYQLEDEFMMSRFVGLASEDRFNEIIIFYHEMLNSATGHSLEAYENSLDEATAKAIEDAFVERSRQSFSIIDG